VIVALEIDHSTIAIVLVPDAFPEICNIASYEILYLAGRKPGTVSAAFVSGFQAVIGIIPIPGYASSWTSGRRLFAPAYEQRCIHPPRDWQAD
jgi:hypothetical protein